MNDRGWIHELGMECTDKQEINDLIELMEEDAQRFDTIFRVILFSLISVACLIIYSTTKQFCTML